MGAVVLYPTGCQTPLSGQFSPVLAVVPSGLRVLITVYLHAQARRRRRLEKLDDFDNTRACRHRQVSFDERLS